VSKNTTMLAQPTAPGGGRKEAYCGDRQNRVRRGFVAATLLLLMSLVTACDGCNNSASSPDASAVATLRVKLYFLSTVAGALEPCGCTKDQLGGLDHLAALLEADQDPSKRLTLAVGPTLFIDPILKADHRAQDELKAEAITASIKQLGVRAWTPGNNDWAAGAAALAKYRASSGAQLLAANLASDAVTGRAVFDVEGVKVGVVGLSEPKDRVQRLPNGVSAKSDELDAVLKQQLAALRDEGATVLVALAALNRGRALRLAEKSTELHVMAVGRPYAEGHANTEPPAPEVVTGTLVVETANHGQTVSVVEVFLQPGAQASVKLHDAVGIDKAEKIAELAQRIRALEHRINGWEKGGKVNAEDLAARKAELAVLRKERTTLESEKPAAPEGSYFRYQSHEVREQLGKSDAVATTMLAYYKKVNAHNKKAFADKKPAPVTEGEAAYLGIDSCTDCHIEEREVWDKTAHAKAYKTLVDDFKEFNLECVGCHVTGYGEPGGSTVTHNQQLRDVQCETCHGPGSLHAAEPEQAGLIVLKPDPQACVDACHHPPHVEGFDPIAKMELVLGPGHERE